MATTLATPYYEDGSHITAFCTTNVGGKTFVAVSADQQSGGSAGVNDSVVGGTMSVNTPGAGAKVIGVAQYDQTSGNLVGVVRAPNVMPVVAGASITAGQEVQTDATGKAIPLAAGKAAGVALANAASGADAKIALYL